MSTVAAPTYASILQLAKQTYAGNMQSLEQATGDAKIKGSIRNLTEECNEHVAEVTSTKVTAQGYEELKAKFVKFTEPLISLYKAVRTARDLGLAAIETLKEAEAKCKGYKQASQEMVQMRHHLIDLGVSTEEFDRKNPEIGADIAVYPFTKQKSDLNTLTKFATKHIKALEVALNNVFYRLKVISGKQKWSDSIPTYRNYYLLEAMKEAESYQKTTRRVTSVPTSDLVKSESQPRVSTGSKDSASPPAQQ